MIIPSIDLMGGKVVQLQQGKEKKLEIEGPVEFAKRLAGFKAVQVIDLDAAMGKGSNLDIVKEISKIVKARVGGGIRAVEKARGVLDAGAEKIIIGTKAKKEFMEELAGAIGKDKIIVAVDSFRGKVVVEGWQKETDITPMELAKELEGYCSEFLYTAVDREGLMSGIDLETIKKLKGATNNRITMAGGISSMEEVEMLDKLGIDAVVGMALYTGKIKLEGVDFG